MNNCLSINLAEIEAETQIAVASAEIPFDAVPQIKLPFSSEEDPNSALHTHLIRNSLKIILPSTFLNLHLCTPIELTKKKELFHSTLPLLTSNFIQHANLNELSFFVLSHYRPNAFKFFFNMISNWLIPGKRLYVSMVYAVDFHLPQFCDDMFTLCEVKLAIHHPEEVVQIQNNLSTIESEIRLGMHSTYHAHKILEIKGLSADEKTALLHQHITALIRRRPEEFNFDLLVEMQHTLLICSDAFKQGRTLRHLSRIISIHYLFRKEIFAALGKEPQRRFVKLKLFKAQVEVNDTLQPVLGILIAINFLQKKEIFDQHHLLNAIQSHIPLTTAVDGSFFINRQHNESLGRIYLEVYKSDGAEFTKEEICLMRHELLHDLQDHIELPMHPIFMPRNEEEIMRNIIYLSKELNSAHAPPQVIISFDEQTQKALIFTVIVLRVVTPSRSATLEQLFSSSESRVEYLHDRYRCLGTIGENMLKEATVFRLKLQKAAFLRKNFSVDLVKARQRISEELTNVLGYFRDFNGGTLAKECELLSDLRLQLKECKKFSSLLLENFFHSISPPHMRSTLEASELKALFLFLLDTHQHAGNSGEPQIFSRCEENIAFVIIRYCDSSGRKEITRRLHENLNEQGQWASIFVAIHPVSYAGYLLRSSLPCEQQHFCSTIYNAIR